MKKTLFCVAAAFAVFLAVSCGGQKTPSTVLVSGVGTVLTQPDMVTMNISLGNTAQTTLAAQEAVNAMVKAALKILKDAGIEDKDISTASLQFRTEYDWNRPQRTVIGQRAEQTLSFSVNDINNSDEKVSAVVDALVRINGIELNHMNFSVKNTGDLFARARELAWQKARVKAEQYAELSGQKVVKARSITEESSPAVFPENNRLTNQSLAYDSGVPAAATMLPAGELEISSRIAVEFLLR